MKPEECILFSGAANGAEAAFGAAAERHGIEEMNFTFTDTPLFRKILQTIWHQINNGQEVYVVGQILKDKTVKGGTGWGAEFAKLCNKPLYVFDQQQDAWFKWDQRDWVKLAGHQ